MGPDRGRIEERRRFNIGDAMVLTAAAALALVIIRGTLVDGIASRPPWLVVLTVVIAVQTVAPPTLLILQLRQPRPSFRRLTRRPGFAATLAGSMVFAMDLIAFAILTVVSILWPDPSPQPRANDAVWWPGLISYFEFLVGPTVLAAWLLLLTSGRRQAHRGWLDISGRMVGTLGVVLFVISTGFRLARLIGR